MPGPSIPRPLRTPATGASSAALARDTMRVPSPPHGASAPAGAVTPPLDYTGQMRHSGRGEAFM